MEPSTIWANVANRVRQEVADPTVWLALRATQPLLIDGSFFVAALSPADEYLAAHLLNNQATSAIEEALRDAAGRILAFRLIIGTSAADWATEKAREAAGAFMPSSPERQVAEPPPAFFRSEATPPPATLTVPSAARPASSQTSASQASASQASASQTAAAPAAREVAQTWEKLSERLSLGYKTAPFVKYPHGQAQYVLTAVKLISDTMDVQMPALGAPRDDTQERLLAKSIERLSGIINLDPLFIALELLRYRELQGKSADIAL